VCISHNWCDQALAQRERTQHSVRPHRIQRSERVSFVDNSASKEGEGAYLIGGDCHTDIHIRVLTDIVPLPGRVYLGHVFHGKSRSFDDEVIHRQLVSEKSDQQELDEKMLTRQNFSVARCKKSRTDGASETHSPSAISLSFLRIAITSSILTSIVR
jgi:hypothetical protein